MTESLYLAGKMRGIENFNRDYFNKVAAKLRELEYEVINPAAFYDPEDFDWYECLRRDIRFLAACDGICLLPGWVDSLGACLEYRTARDLGLDVLFWDENIGCPHAAFVIGICGYAQSGKDTLGFVLSEFGFSKVAFADKLKEVAFAALPDQFQQEVLELDTGYDKLFDGAKQEEVWRSYLQRFGTEGIRKLDEDFWVKTVLDNLDSFNVCITDVRFLNELQAIHNRGGICVWVSRDGIGPVNTHSSDNSLSIKDCDVVIDNNHDFDHLRRQVKELLDKYEQ